MSRRVEIVRAETLSNVGLSDDECDMVVDDNIANINAILSTYPVVMGENRVEYDLPSNFPFTSDLDDMRRANRQFMIYGMIIERLESAGYKTKINLTTNGNTLYIMWESKFDAGKLTKYVGMIKSRLLSKT
jgi:hypothetical protein